jgi:hypothetical protein
MGVRKIFIVLITIVACIIIGALVLNTLLPNVSASLVNSLEDTVFKATKMSFDWNNDGKKGGTNTTNDYTGYSTDKSTTTKAGVEGFK